MTANLAQEATDQGPQRPYTVLTITHKRNGHLQHLLHGVEKQTNAPSDIVVVYMNQRHHIAYTGPLELTSLNITGHRLPLAAARNLAAAHATQATLVFLDVDCIPAPDFAKILLGDLTDRPGLIMGTPRYLPAQVRYSSDMREKSYVHPVRANLPLRRPVSHNLFWSLCFATSANDFRTAGGFDEVFSGYGGEDTDFAQSYAVAGLGFSLSPAEVYHQFHPSYSPPINHFNDVVRNARTYFAKWGKWPMTGWLSAFATRGLIRWHPDGHVIEVERYPTANEIEGARSISLFG